MNVLASVDNNSGKVQSEQISAKGARRVVAGREPLVQARRVEFLLASPASQFGQLMAGAVQDKKADVALLYAVEPLVQVLLPDGEAVNDGAVLVLQECRQLKHPGMEIGTLVEDESKGIIHYLT